MSEQLNENKNTKQQNKNINDESTLIFPEEIWLLIFSQPSIDLVTILNLSLACKKFKILSDDNVCWQNLNMQNFGFVPSLNQRQTSFDENQNNSADQALTQSMTALSKRLTVSSPTPVVPMLYQKNFFKNLYLVEQLKKQNNRKEMKINSLLEFPDEILLLIFSQPSIDLITILHLKLVCKRFDILTDDNVCWKNLNMQNFGFAPSLNQGQTKRSSAANQNNSWAQTLTRSMAAFSKRLTVNSRTPSVSMLYQKNFFKSRYQEQKKLLQSGDEEDTKTIKERRVQKLTMELLTLERLNKFGICSFVKENRDTLIKLSSAETLPNIAIMLVEENAITAWTALMAEHDLAIAMFGFNPNDHTEAFSKAYRLVVDQILKNNTNEFIVTTLEWHKQYYDSLKNKKPDKTIGTKEIFVGGGLFNANANYISGELSILALTALMELSEDISLKANAANFLLQKATDQQERVSIIEKLYGENSKILEQVLKCTTLELCCEVVNFMSKQSKYSIHRLRGFLSELIIRFPDHSHMLKWHQTNLTNHPDQPLDLSLSNAFVASFQINSANSQSGSSHSDQPIEASSFEENSSNSQSDSSVEESLGYDVQDEIEELKARIESLSRTIVSQQSQIQQLTKSWIFSNDRSEEVPESEAENTFGFFTNT